MSHLPGEWSYEPDAEYVYGYDEKGRRTVIADDVHHRNGPLITAAPDLLAALRELMKYDHVFPSGPCTGPLIRTKEKCLSAIAKAEGRS